MALSPDSNEAFLREVDDAVREDRLRGLWARYGRAIIAAVAVALVLFGAWLFWQHRREQNSAQMSETADRLLKSMEGTGPLDEKALAQLAGAGQPGYRAMAALTRAAASVNKGDVKGAAAQYGAIAADADMARPYRDLALVRQVALNFDAMPPQQVIDTLKPLSVAGEPWFGSAGEMTAIAYMKLRKPELAGTTFAALARDENVPQSVRARARQMAGLLGVDAVDSDGEDKGNNARTSE